LKGLDKHGWLFATIVVLGGLLLLTILVTSREDATNLENGLLQFIFLGAGVGFSFYTARKSAQAAAVEVLRPHGAKSVRRLLTLAAGIQNYSVVIDKERAMLVDLAQQGQVPVNYASHSLDVVQAHIDGELRTVSDALEDWRDVVPEEVQLVEEGQPDA
jgi:hypothetical protein